MTQSTSRSMVVSAVRIWMSGSCGASYAESMPVKFSSLPSRALRYRPLGSRRSHSASGVSTKISMKSSARQTFARQLSLGAERRDERDQDDQSCIGHQPGRLDHAPDVLDAVGIGEAEIATEAVADIVAIQRISVSPEREQPLLDAVGDRRLARARQARKPQDGRTMPLDRRPCGPVDGEVVPTEVRGAAQRKADHAGADRRVADPVDQDETASLSVLVVGVERHHPVEREGGKTDFVQGQLLGGLVQSGTNVDQMLELTHRRRQRGGADLHQIGPAREHRRIAHPHEMRCKLVGLVRRLLRIGNDVAAAHVDCLGKGEGHSVARVGPGEIAIVGHDTVDVAALARGQNHDLIAWLDAAAEDCPGIAAEAGAVAIDPLHRQSEGLVVRPPDADSLELLQQRRPAIPWHGRARPDDIVTQESRERDGRHCSQSQPFGHRGIG